MVGFIFGGNTGLSYSELQDRRARADLLARQIMGQQPKTVAQGIGAVLGGIGAGIGRYQANKGMREGQQQASSTFDSILSRITGQPPAGGGNAYPPQGSAANIPTPGAASEMAATRPADVSQNGSTFSPFIDTVKTGIKTDDGSTLAVTNPYGLAAVAATGRAESQWSPTNAARSWSDPSESGQAGTAGGVMSWRAERLQALRNYAASKGEQGNGSPQTQAEFFLREDPQLVASLNNAKSVEEAQSLMNNAWRFRGYNRPGGEAGRRLSYASGYVSQFQGQGQPNAQVASLDPSSGMSSATAAIERQAPGSGYVDPDVSAPNYRPQTPAQPAAPMPAAFDMGRFGDAPQPQAAPSPAMGGDATAYANAGPMQKGQRLPMPSQGQQVAAAPQQDGATLSPLPTRTIAPSPAVASVPQQAPVQVAQLSAPQMPQMRPYQVDREILRFLASPFADEGQKQALQMVVRQQMEQHEQAQQQQLWQYRQDYDQFQRRSDPAYQQQLQLGNIQLDQARGPKYTYTTLPDGTVLRTDPRGGPPQKVYESAAKPTANMQDYEAYAADERAAGRQPVGRLQYEQEIKKAGSSSTTVNVGEGDNFFKELDKKNADTFNTLSQAGIEARGKLARIDRLEGLMANAPQGAVGALKQAAGEWGIPTEGVSDIQAASALLEKMVPEQRLPGSGTMSDGDIKMFRNSLPKIINQPGGNQLIFQTLRGIAQYEQQMGDIADAVADRELSPAEGRQRIRELKNPLADFKLPSGPTPNEGFQDRPDLGPGIRIKKLGD